MLTQVNNRLIDNENLFRDKTKHHSSMNGTPNDMTHNMTISNASESSSSNTGGRWDTKTQQYHGGQEWMSLNNFVEDFSVTTNGLGLPKRAMEAAIESISDCIHYPTADQEPAKSSLAYFLDPNGTQNIHQRLILGNGASELIDLVTRLAPKGPFKPGPWVIQYKEYERSAAAQDRLILNSQDPTPASLICIVNPNNPTGDYMNIQELKEYIQVNTTRHAVVMVDESMQPWHSPQFYQDSLLSQREWIENMFYQHGIAVFIMHSWTKLWSCTGLRLGSVICPTLEHVKQFQKIQVPWSVNVPALAFLNQVVNDQDYLETTWTKTPIWHAYLRNKLKTLSLTKGFYGPWEFSAKPFLSWIWIDMKNEALAAQAVALAKRRGVPVRPGVHGYRKPTCVRVAVRSEELTDILVDAWKELSQT